MERKRAVWPLLLREMTETRTGAECHRWNLVCDIFLQWQKTLGVGRERQHSNIFHVASPSQNKPCHRSMDSLPGWKSETLEKELSVPTC